MKEDLIWDLKMEGVTELQINQIKASDVRHNGVIFVINAKTNKKDRFLLSDRVNNKLITFTKNKKPDELLFAANTNFSSVNKSYYNERFNKNKRVCFAD